MKRVLRLLLVLLALIVANSIYLATVTFLEWTTTQPLQNYFYGVMFLSHLIGGLIVMTLVVVFGSIHIRHARRNRNELAIRIGYAVFFVSLAILVTGLLLVRIVGLFDLRQPVVRLVLYWLHVGCPLLTVWLYWLHRLAGPRVRWKSGVTWSVGCLLVLAVFARMHSHDPRRHGTVIGDATGQPFAPALARTASARYISARALMMDPYCMTCHADIHSGWEKSVHHFSSFNNPAYLATIRDATRALLQRDGTAKASRWCAGCHDPVALLSGAFDQPGFDFIRHPTGQAGITCTVCHAITSVNSTQGNGDYTIDEPIHYPFAYSDNAVLQWVNHQLIKAKPSFHKKTFLKPVHRTAEFCSVCHKVHLPFSVTRYKQFLRGQNHYDSFLLSGVSGHGARSFYYPAKAEKNCNDCHMPLAASDDFGAADFDGSGTLSIHDHLFPSANTAVAWMNGDDDAVAAHKKFNDDVMRVDIFGCRDGGTIDGTLYAPLRPNVPTLQPGKTYLLDVVIRTLKMGHHFTQGTTDSNEIWLKVTVTSGARTIGRSGDLNSDGTVDPWAHFVNVFMLDRDGNRIDRRNAQGIFVPLYNHQIPPGAGQTVHYQLTLPENLTAPIHVDVQLQYRKFDTTYWRFINNVTESADPPRRGIGADQSDGNPFPIMTLASDAMTFPVAGIDVPIKNAARSIPAWERWNDYGIGMLLKGKAELRQASAAFRQVEALGRYDGALNLARAMYREGRLNDATTALQRAAAFANPPAPRWTLAWLAGLVNRENNRLDDAAQDFYSVLEDRTPEMLERGFDFSRDYEVRNLLALTLFDRARQLRQSDQQTDRNALLHRAVDEFKKTLAVDSENVTAHYGLARLYSELGDAEKASQHAAAHDRYRPDDNARGRAVRLARQRYPAANHAAEAVVIYRLKPPTESGPPAESRRRPAPEATR